MTKIRIAATALSLASVWQVGHSDEPTSVFGLLLQQPLSVAECAYRRFGTTALYMLPTSAPCYEHVSPQEAGKALAQHDTLLVRWPLAMAPALASSGSVIVGVFDGKLESVGFNTLGVRSARLDLEQLKRKFGTPTTVATPTVQNGFGATFESVRADWQIGDVVVYFNSTEDGLDTGLVRIETRKSVEHREQVLSKLRGTPL